MSPITPTYYSPPTSRPSTAQHPHLILEKRPPKNKRSKPIPTQPLHHEPKTLSPQKHSINAPLLRLLITTHHYHQPRSPQPKDSNRPEAETYPYTELDNLAPCSGAGRLEVVGKETDVDHGTLGFDIMNRGSGAGICVLVGIDLGGVEGAVGVSPRG